MDILLTGSTGFVGSALLLELQKLASCSVTCAIRKKTSDMAHSSVVVGDIHSTTDYSEALTGKDVVIHAAARAHIMNEYVKDPLAEYRKVNVEGSKNLAKQAAAHGVKRFIFISSVKVSGESTSGKPAFDELMEAAPEDAYGQSKFEAEEALKKIAAETDMELIIIRPPLVYGPGVKANFFSLLKLCKLPVPLPFGLISNQRSMVYLENLADFIIQCIDHPKAANQTFLISDGQDLSLKSLIRTIRRSMNKPIWLFPIPVWLFKLIGKLTNKTAMLDRLIGGLQVDSSKAQRLLEWTPHYTVEEGIKATVADFYNRK